MGFEEHTHTSVHVERGGTGCGLDVDLRTNPALRLPLGGVRRQKMLDTSSQSQISRLNRAAPGTWNTNRGPASVLLKCPSVYEENQGLIESTRD